MEKGKVNQLVQNHINSKSEIPLRVGGFDNESTAKGACEAIKQWVEETGTHPVLSGYGQDDAGRWFFQVWSAPDIKVV